MITTIIFLVALLAASAFFSGSETALMSLGLVKARVFNEQGRKNSQRLLYLAQNPNKTLATLLIGNNIVNIAASAIATALAISLIGPSGTGIAAIVMTILVLTFGEILPKSFAAHFSDRVATTVAGPIYILSLVLSPFIFVFNWMSWVVVSIFGGGKRAGLITAAEIRTMVSLGHQEGVLEQSQGEIIHNVFEFGDTEVREIMTPRLDLTTVDIETTVDVAAEMLVEHGIDRLAVYEEDSSFIIGVVHIEDVLAAKVKAAPQMVRDLVRPAFVIPESKHVGALFDQMQKERISSAVVVDEYGVAAGMVSQTDLVQDIVGELRDEHHESSDPVQTGGDGIIILNGRMSIDEVNDALGTSLPDDYSQTLGGWIFHKLGRLPLAGDAVGHEGIEYIVVAMEHWRIDKVQARRTAEAK